MSYHRKRLGLGDSSAPPSGVKLPECPSNVDGWCQMGGNPFYVGIGKSTISAEEAKKASGSKAGDIAGAFFKALTGGFGAGTMTAPAPAVIVAPPSSGPSTTTIALIGGAALVAVLLLTGD